MPTVAQIEQALFQLAPKDLAFDWDNVGHLEGSPDQEVQRVLVALDVTENVVSEAEKLGCQLIVSHHPLMNVRWHQAEMQTLRPDRYLGRLLRRLVKADISVISMHTNLDIAPGGVNDALAEALRIEDPGPMPGDETGLCRVGRLRNPVKLPDFAADVCKCVTRQRRTLCRGPAGRIYSGGRRRLRRRDRRGDRGRLRHLCHVGSDVSPVFRRRSQGHQPHRRGAFPHGGPGLRENRRLSGEGISPAYNHKIDFSQGSHPIFC